MYSTFFNTALSGADSTVSEDVGVENPELSDFSMDSHADALTTWLDLIHTRLDLIHTWLNLIHSRLDLILTRLDPSTIFKSKILLEKFTVCTNIL